MNKVALLFGLPLLLAGCATVPVPSPVSGDGQLQMQTIVLPNPLKLSGGIQAARVRQRETSIRHTWELTKAVVDDGQDNTAVFTVTATKSTVSGTVIKSLTTTISSASSVQLCNTGTAAVTVTGSSATLTGLDASNVALTPTLTLGSVFGALPVTLAAGACQSGSFSVSSSDAGLSTAQQDMLNNAATFKLDVKASTATKTATAQASATPTFDDQNTTTVVGDDSVTLTDPGFQSTPALPLTINQTTTVQVGHTYTCADVGTLVAVNTLVGQSIVPPPRRYRVPNTAYLDGATTHLTASSEDTITLTCTTPPAVSGCTYTQGYYKTHAQFRSEADAQSGRANKQYDPQAWAGARAWNGNETLLALGGASYSQGALVQVYLTAPAGNQAVSLFHQLATAKLNTLKASPPAVSSGTVSQAISDAEAFFAANPNWLQGQYAGDPTQWIGLLTSFNEGLENGHC